MIGPVQYNAVYLVEEIISNKPVREDIAIRPKIDALNKTIEWADTGYGHYIEYNKLSQNNEKNPKEIKVFTCDSNYKFSYLTVNLYNKIFKDKVAKKPDFATDIDVQNHYLNEVFI